MTDKHTNSFEERNFKTQQDQADFRMQQMLKEKGFVRGASEKDLEKYSHIAGSYQKVGTDPKDGFVANYWLISKVLILPDYIVYPRESLVTYLVEVKGTNKLKQEDFNKLKEMFERAEVVNDQSKGIKIEVGVYYFANPSTNKIGKYINYQDIQTQWDEIADYKEFPEKDWRGKPKYYKEMPWNE